MTPPPAAVAPAVRPSRRPIEPSSPARRRGLAAPAPRRVSGPVRRAPGDRGARRPSRERAGLVTGLIAAAEVLSPRSLLDQLAERRARTRPSENLLGRAWIAVVAFALIGIVTLQLGLLKLNGGIGRALEHTALLQRENAALSVENSEMAASDRIQTRAAALGMELVAPGALHFLAAEPRSAPSRAAAALRARLTASQAGSGEAPAGSASSSASSATSPSSSEASGSGAAQAAGQASATAPGTSSASSEQPPAAAEQRPPAAESTTASAPGSAGTAAPGSGASAGSGEAAPAGGTQPGGG